MATPTFKHTGNSGLWAILIFAIGFLLGNLNGISSVARTELLLSQMEPVQVQVENVSKEATKPKKRPLQVFPLLKELGAGWNLKEVGKPLDRKAHGTNSLVVDVGLDKGVEFFLAQKNGFEVVGFEPNPESFEKLSLKCQEMETCHPIPDIRAQKLPLERTPGHSYLIHAGAGKENAELELSLKGPVGSFVELNALKGKKKAKVPVVRVDDVIAEDVFLFKIDTQGFDHFVLQGSQKIFQNHVVRQVIFEVDPLPLKQLGIHSMETILQVVQNDYGMMCFSARTDNKKCGYVGDDASAFTKRFFTEMRDMGRAWAECWEDFICLNVEKVYPKTIPRMR